LKSKDADEQKRASKGTVRGASHDKTERGKGRT